MPIINFYNHTAKRQIAGENSISDEYKVVLLNASGTFNAAHVTLDEVTASGSYEVYGNGWTQGGEVISTMSAAISETDSGIITADALSVPISGGDLGPFSYFVIVNTTDSGSPPVAHIELDSPQTVPDGYTWHCPWDDGTLFIVSVA
jgi:hypothetical protein